tara:strand:- start:21239 stop:22606 length:1368 start_codon:yes stop_codon:yes gene_type:complete
MASFSPFEKDRNLNSPNRNISPITSEVNERGALIIGGCILSDLAKKYGTPLYVLDEATLRTSCRSYLDALKENYPGPSLPLYASKANSSLVICNIISSEGLGLDAVSEGELLTALRAGVPGKNIVLHGNNKSDQELYFAYTNGATIVIDNNHDIERLEKIIPNDKEPVNLMLRFTPGIECHTHEYIKTGHLDSKFGFDPEQLEVVYQKLLESKWANLTGLHAHIGSQIFEIDPHHDLVKVMIESLLLADKIGHSIKDLNVGGGLGVKYVFSDDPPSINKWIKVISDSVVEACKSKNIPLPRLMCEPGRSLVSSSGVTLYTIGARKNIPGIRTYISVDGGMSDNPRPITYQSLYTACLADRALEENNEVVTVAGKHCESGDILLKDYPLPVIKSNEVLCVFGTGAYNFSMSSNYNRIPRPAAVIVNNGFSEIVQRRETTEDLLRMDVLPDRFIGVH